MRQNISNVHVIGSCPHACLRWKNSDALETGQTHRKLKKSNIYICKTTKKQRKKKNKKENHQKKNKKKTLKTKKEKALGNGNKNHARTLGINMVLCDKWLSTS